MATDKQAQEERARRLREQVEALRHLSPGNASPGNTPPGNTPSGKPKSLRDAVRDKMRELDAKKPH